MMGNIASAHIVLGAFYGDEGKGQFTSHLARTLEGSKVVVRFNGGHQAGHTVVREDGYRHVFSSFCSGALHGVPSFISRFCTVSPAAVCKEFESLLANRDAATNLSLTVDPRCPIVTPFDMIANRIRHRNSGGNRTVGVGFGDTVERHENSPYKIFASDLHSPMLRDKVKSVYDYYEHSLDSYDISQGLLVEEFMTYAERMKSIVKIQTFGQVIKSLDHVIFEGAQGIQLDMEHGVFPYVTRSKTTCRNAMELMMKDAGASGSVHTYYNTYYVLRPYVTRHGDGPMPAGHFPKQEDETNVTNEYQGSLRFAPFSIELLKHSMLADSYDCPDIGRQSNVVVTHASVHPELADKVSQKIRFENVNRLTRVFTFDGETLTGKN
jgi:adenylosuccinate synthase